ncbi:hypothetical protein [Chitinophaga sp. ARDCPP14]|uniref:hypothetical protein n=1 Tax=Chitinophaga sp. ARDCPP14 TaxID=3391139 RepID=UPI003F52467C
MENLKREIDQSLNKIDLLDVQFQDYAKQMILPDSNMFLLDIYAIGIVNRALSLTSGFSTLIRQQNFIAASHLVRPYLDTYLQFFAVWQVSDINKFVSDVMKGDRIDKLKDKNGVLMQDKHLVTLASIDYEWMLNVYKETSGFIHFSKKHIFTSSRLKDPDSRIIEGRVSKYDKYVPDESRLEAVQCMLAISQAIFKLLEGWIWTKQNPEELEKIKEKEAFKNQWSKRVKIIGNLYTALNEKRVRDSLAFLHENVLWPTSDPEKFLEGHAAVKSNWKELWKTTTENIQPISFSVLESKDILIDAHVIVRDLNMAVKEDYKTQHLFEFDNDLIKRIDIIPYKD